MKEKLDNVTLPLAAAFTGKMISMTLTYKLENLTVYRQSGIKKVLDCKGSFQALAALEISSAVVWWLIYHNSYLYISEKLLPETIEFTSVLLSGAFSSFLTTLLTHPLDLHRLVKLFAWSRYPPLMAGLYPKILRFQLMNSLYMPLYLLIRSTIN